MIGIDFSMSSAAIVIGESNNPDELQMMCFRQRVKDTSLVKNIRISEYPISDSNEKRYFELANEIIEFIIKNTKSKIVWIEDYSFGSTGSVFNIAEATATLKHMLWMKGYEINKISPKSIKKFATGTGNADKNKMYDSFFKNTKYNFNEKLEGPTKDLRMGYKQVPSPVSDLIDAYFILQYGLNQ